MKLTTIPNTGSLSEMFYVDGTPHLVIQDWATLWYRVLLRVELSPITIRGQTFRKYKDIGISDWLKTSEELETYLDNLEKKVD